MLNFCPVDTRAEVEKCWLFVTADIFLYIAFSIFKFLCLYVLTCLFLHCCVFQFSNPFCIFLKQGQKLWHVGFLWHVRKHIFVVKVFRGHTQHVKNKKFWYSPNIKDKTVLQRLTFPLILLGYVCVRSL